MWSHRRSGPRRVAIAGAGAIVVGAIFLGTGGPDGDSAAAQIPGAPLELSAPPAAEVAAFVNLAEEAPKPAAPAVKAPIDPATLNAATLDLDKITPGEEQFTAVLADGRHAKLTIDPDLQKLAEKLLDESRAPRGAIVVMAPDGRILALAGRKTDKPEGSREGTFDWRLATDAWAPAASVFKLVTASALVRAGVGPEDKVCYHGGIRSVLEHNLQDDRRDNRCENLAYGVAHSNNAILGKLAFQKLAPQALEAEARLFGWSTPLPTLPGVTGALVVPPTRDLDFAKTAAGFSSDVGGAKLSAVGGALVAATFARDGDQPVPRLIASIDDAPVAPAPARHVLEPATARAVAKMMVQTCEGGSAAKSFGHGGPAVAGKTGTLSKNAPFYMEHSWFVGFAPADKPEIVVSVLLGNAESWHLRGHEAARRIIDKHLKRDAKGREKDRTPRRQSKRPPS